MRAPLDRMDCRSLMVDIQCSIASNILHGDSTDCKKNKFLNYVDICGNIV